MQPLLILKALRLSRGLTQRALADAADMLQPHISAFETGTIRPGPERLRRLSEVLQWPGDPEGLLAPWVAPKESRGGGE